MLVIGIDGLVGRKVVDIESEPSFRPWFGGELGQPIAQVVVDGHLLSGRWTFLLFGFLITLASCQKQNGQDGYAVLA